MSPRTFVVGILALVCGVSASVGVNSLRAPAAVQAKPDVTIVPVAAIDVKRGEKFTEEMLVGREWPTAMLPPGAVVKKADIVGRIAQVSLVKDEPIFAGKVGDSERFSGLVPEGMRAYTILTPSDSSLVAGLVEPGDKVDILYTDQTDKVVTGGASTTTLMQNVEVLALGRIVDPEQSREAKRMRSVTLLVMPEMASMLALAQEMGTLHLTLRSETDQLTANVSGVTLTELLRTAYGSKFGNKAAAESDVVQVSAEAPAEPQKTPEIAIRTIRGMATSTVVMQASGKRTASAYSNRNLYGGGTPFPSTGGGEEGTTQ
jgi:pilus assembly protein CpaB